MYTARQREEKAEVRDRILSERREEIEERIRQVDRLVFSIALKSWNRMHPQMKGSLDVEDLAQEGRMALWKASCNYDPETSQFTTFAHHVVSQRMKQLHSNMLGKTKQGNTTHLPITNTPPELTESKNVWTEENVPDGTTPELLLLAKERYLAETDPVEAMFAFDD